jgi:hypothetical protein
MNPQVLTRSQVPILGRMKKDFATPQCVGWLGAGHSQELRRVLDSQILTLFFWEMLLTSQERSFWHAFDAESVTRWSNVNMTAIFAFAISVSRLRESLQDFSDVGV